MGSNAGGGAVTGKPITAEQIAAMSTALRHPETWNGSESDYAEGLAMAADMLDQMAAELAQLTDDYADAFARGVAHGQKVMPKGTFHVVYSPELATLRAERDALRTANQRLHRRAQKAEGANAAAYWWVSYAAERADNRLALGYLGVWFLVEIKKALERAAKGDAP